MTLSHELVQFTFVLPDPPPLAIVLVPQDHVTGDTLHGLAEELKRALGEKCPPIVLLPPGVTFESISDPERVPGWWEKKG